MTGTNYISPFRKLFGSKTICSENYSKALHSLQGYLYKSEHGISRYKSVYPQELKRPTASITYVDAEAASPCPNKYKILWTLPSPVHPIRFSPDDETELDMQVWCCMLDCIIWTKIIYSNDAKLNTLRPTEQIVLFLLFKYVSLNCQRISKSKTWSAGITYNELLDHFYKYIFRLLMPTDDVSKAVLDRNRINFYNVHKKKVGEPYVFKSHAGDHSNSATCLVRYTDEQLAVIKDRSLSLREAAGRLQELGCSIAPTTVSRVRKRLEKPQRKAKATQYSKEQALPPGALF